MSYKWTFFDPVDSTGYTFDVNPSDGGSPTYESNVAYENTTAPNGKTIIFEGLDQPQKVSFSGVLLFQAQYDAFVAWKSKKHQILVTDDLGRQFTIIITAFKPKRERAVQYPWKHSYSVDYTIVNWP